MKLALCALLVAASAASADIVRFTFTGTFTMDVGPIAAPIAVGSPYTFVYDFDTTTPDLDPSPNFGDYAGAIKAATVTSTGFQFSAAPGNISVLNDGFAGDTYSAGIADAVRWANIGMTDFSSGAFQGDPLPDNLVLSQFNVRQFSLHQDVGPAYWEVRGTVTTFSRVVLPACYADCNGDSVLNIADFGCFQTKFALQDPYADCNMDGLLNIADFGCFQTKFALGCP